MHTLLERNPEEASQNYIATLGREFGEFFFHLDQSVVGLVSIWDVYRALFGTNKERVDLLNSASGYVTRTFQDSLHERIILGICQVSDPPGSGTRKNVTVHGLSTYLSDARHRAEIEILLLEVETKTFFARELRNKLIAHSDLATVSGSRVIDFSSRTKIVDAIQSIIKPLRYVHRQLFDTHKLYHPITEGTHGFLECVFLGVTKRKEDIELLRLGSGQKLHSTSFPHWMAGDGPNEFD